MRPPSSPATSLTRSRVFLVALVAAAAALPVRAGLAQQDAGAVAGRGVSVPAENIARPDAPLGAPLVLGALYAIADSANPRVLAARASVRASAAQARNATRPPDPRVQLGWMNRELPSLAPMSPLGMVQLQVMQMLPTAGKLRLAARAAEGRATSVAFRAQDLAWEVRAEVAAAFFDLYRADGATAIARDTRRLMEHVATVADAMYRVGEAPQADVLAARVEVARMTEELVVMDAMRRVAVARLGGLLDRAFDDSVVAWRPAFPRDLPTLAALEAEALAARPMLRAGDAELAAADASRRLARRELVPDLEVGVQYGQRAGAMGTEHMGSLMLGAALPIFASRRQLAMREEAEAMHAMTAAELRGMRAETRARVAAAYAEWSRARQLQALYRGTVLPQARAAVDAALASYRVGGVTLMALLDAQATVNRYRQEVVVLEAAEGMALADLEMLLGRALFDATQLASPEEAR